MRVRGSSLYCVMVDNWVGTSMVVGKEDMDKRGQGRVHRPTAGGSGWKREGNGKNLV